MRRLFLALLATHHSAGFCAGVGVCDAGKQQQVGGRHLQHPRSRHAGAWGDLRDGGVMNLQSQAAGPLAFCE
jgi:hypothetical protein